MQAKMLIFLDFSACILCLVSFVVGVNVKLNIKSDVRVTHLLFAFFSMQIQISKQSSARKPQKKSDLDNLAATEIHGRQRRGKNKF